MSDVHRIEMRPVWAGGRAGYRYDLFHEGLLVVERTSQPLCDAARWLQDGGKDGKVELWRPVCAAIPVRARHWPDALPQAAVGICHSRHRGGPGR